MKSFLLFVTLSLLSVFNASASVGSDPNAYVSKIMNGRFDNVKHDLYEASKISGVSMGDMVGIASLESGLTSGAANKHSSAKGVFQYINSTWKSDRKKFHQELGLPHNASVFDQRANILIAGKSLAATKENLIERTHLTKSTIRPGDLYMSHFLGESGAVRVINSKSNTPMNTLVNISAANRPLFVKPNGQVRTAREFRQFLDKRVAKERAFYEDRVREHRIAMLKVEVLESLRGKHIVPVQIAAIGPLLALNT